MTRTLLSEKWATAYLCRFGSDRPACQEELHGCYGGQPCVSPCTVLGGSPGSGTITVPSEHFKLPPMALPFSSSMLALSRTDPPMAFDSTLKSEELPIINAPLIVFPMQEEPNPSSGSPMTNPRGTVALCTSTLPLIWL